MRFLGMSNVDFETLMEMRLSVEPERHTMNSRVLQIPVLTAPRYRPGAVKDGWT